MLTYRRRVRTNDVCGGREREEGEREGDAKIKKTATQRRARTEGDWTYMNGCVICAEATRCIFLMRKETKSSA